MAAGVKGAASRAGRQDSAGARRPTPRRKPPTPPASRAGDLAKGAVAGGAVVAGAVAVAPSLDIEDRFKKRFVTPEPAPAPAPVADDSDPSGEAHKMIDKLNAMRRVKPGGGEVQEGPAMMKEINRLLALGDEKRNAPLRKPSAPQRGGAPTQTSGQAAVKFQQEAREQMARLNQYRKQGSLSPAIDRQMTNEINHLFHLADEARAGR